MTAAGIDQVGTGQSALFQMLIHDMLQQNFQIEGFGSEHLQHIFVRHLVDEVLYSGNIHAHQQKRLLLIRSIPVLKQKPAVILDSFFLYVCVDAAGDRRRNLAVVIQGNVAELAFVRR